MSLNRLTCTPLQSKQLVALGILPWAFLWHNTEDLLHWETALFKYPELSEKMLPAWTFAELGAMIGPRYKKPDLWTEEIRDKSATDPNTYPVYFPGRVMVYTNGAEAAAAGLIYLLENCFIEDPNECNERYNAIFKPAT